MNKKIIITLIIIAILIASFFLISYAIDKNSEEPSKSTEELNILYTDLQNSQDDFAAIDNALDALGD
jgi:peptidoglycan hydrolase CwlO-like protein